MAYSFPRDYVKIKELVDKALGENDLQINRDITEIINWGYIKPGLLSSSEPKKVSETIIYLFSRFVRNNQLQAIQLLTRAPHGQFDLLSLEGKTDKTVNGYQSRDIRSPIAHILRNEPQLLVPLVNETCEKQAHSLPDILKHPLDILRFIDELIDLASSRVEKLTTEQLSQLLALCTPEELDGIRTQEGYTLAAALLTRPQLHPVLTHLLDTYGLALPRTFFTHRPITAFQLESNVLHFAAVNHYAQFPRLLAHAAVDDILHFRAFDNANLLGLVAMDCQDPRTNTLKNILKRLTPAQASMAAQSGHSALHHILNIRYTPLYFRQRQLVHCGIVLEYAEPSICHHQTSQGTAADIAAEFHSDSPIISILLRLYQANFKLFSGIEAFVKHKAGSLPERSSMGAFFLGNKKEVFKGITLTEEDFFGALAKIDCSDYRADMGDDELLPYLLDKLSHLPKQSLGTCQALVNQLDKSTTTELITFIRERAVVDTPAITEGETARPG